MLSLNLAPIFTARGITKPYNFLVKAGLSPHTASNILSNDMRIFRLDHIELLCTVFLCEPNDLLLWTPKPGQQYADDFPLAKLKQVDTPDNWQQTLATMPLKQLREITKIITNTESNP